MIKKSNKSTGKRYCVYTTKRKNTMSFLLSSTAIDWSKLEFTVMLETNAGLYITLKAVNYENDLQIWDVFSSYRTLRLLKR